MVAGYVAHRRFEPATFELFVRHLPERRPYLVTAGLSEAVAYLTEFGFSGEDLDYLRGLEALGGADPSFWEYLRGLRFSGEAWAMPEGTVAFADEPIVRVRAPLPEAQIVETALLSSLVYPTLVATKAARIVDAACCDGRERPVIDFGARRAPGFEAACLAARAAAIGGCQATSNVEAGRRYGLQTVGTMAHSWVLSWPDERDAFVRYEKTFPGRTVALVDTYDTARGVRRAARSVSDLGAIRLDSGDLARLAKEARGILDAEGKESTRILASGDLNEERVRALVESGAPIDVYAVGTDLVASLDAPALSAVYKMVEIETDEGVRPVRKKSAGKATLPGAKQVFRETGADGRFRGDVVGLANEPAPGGTAPLLVPVIRKGRREGPPEALDVIRSRARSQRLSLSPPLREAGSAASYPVRLSERLLRLGEEAGGDPGGGGNRKD
jgi:nicotinate phosphoribosyltransferase